jgi:SAM-dependent methyltransferase
VYYENAILPAKQLRLCGTEFQDDAYYLASAQAEADRLVTHFGLTLGSSILDVGCGVGRLATGILSRIGDIRDYHGIDVSKRAIEWCLRHITRKHPSFRFMHIDVRNLRYNPGGKLMGDDFRFPFNGQGLFDIIYLYSVFSHMTKEDVRSYLREFQRILTSSGNMFLTAFIEEGVPNMTINPQGYRMDWGGSPLHCVRYSKDYFESLLTDNGFGIDRFDYEKEDNGQSALYISRRKIRRSGGASNLPSNLRSNLPPPRENRVTSMVLHRSSTTAAP